MGSTPLLLSKNKTVLKYDQIQLEPYPKMLNPQNSEIKTKRTITCEFFIDGLVVDER